MEAPWGSNTSSLGKVTTSYSANTTTVTDPAGVARTNTYDGLGRLTRVHENGISATTCYGYDVLDNLTSVRQGAAASGSSCTGGQLRTFAYDSLSRLKTAVNPESGTTTYSYDRNGNLKMKTDPRQSSSTPPKNGKVTHTYDKLDRITGTSYSGGGTDFSSTPAVTYTYSADGASGCKNKHRLTSVSSGLHFSPRGEAKCVRGPSGLAASRAEKKARIGVTLRFTGRQTFLLEQTKPPA